MPPNPEIDFTLLWQAINGVVEAIQNFFQNIWQQVSNIVNAGQGLFAGLVSFGSFLWDSIQKFGEWIWKAATEAFGQLGEHLVRAFEYIRSAFYAFGEWIHRSILDAAKNLSEGFELIRKQIENIGSWIIQALITAWNVLYKTFSGLAQALQDWWSNVSNTVNQWWTNTMLGVRKKLKQSIGASLGISLAWKSAEKFIEKVSEGGNIRGMFASLLGIPASLFVGYATAEFIDALIPNPSTAVFPLLPTLPSFTYTPPAFEVPRLEEFKAIKEEIGEYVTVEVRKPIG